MKKLFSILMVAAMLAGLMAVSATRTYAQTAIPTPAPGVSTSLTTADGGSAEAGDPNVVTLGTMGFVDDTLRGPFDSTRVLFNVPADWQLTSGAKFQLEVAVFYGGVGESIATPVAGPKLGGTLEVSFNGAVIGTVLLDAVGQHIVSLSIPDQLLVSTRSDGRHSLTISLDSALDCDFDQQTLVVVRNQSLFVLPHQAKAPSTELASLPQPFFQNSFEQESAVIVVPTQPSTVEMQAALAVAAGFGNASGGALAVSLVPVEQLTTSVRDANNLIFVGKATAFPSLSEVALPAPLSGGVFNAAGASPDDGVIQLAVSPWNSGKAVLVVGGNDDVAVLKAGLAISSGTVRSGPLPNLALVAAVNTTVDTSSPPTDRTLADLGYSDETVSGLGFNVIEYTFEVPSVQSVGPDAYFDLVFAHSKLLQYNRSGIVVTLNNAPVGSARFSDDTAEGTTSRVVLPRSAMIAGTNVVQVRADLVPATVCIDPRLARLWLRVDSTSLLHLPISAVPSSATTSLDLSRYPQPFNFGSLLGQTAFVLPSNDAAAWNVAARIAADLGDRSGATLANMAVAYGDSVSDELRQTHNLIVVGRASTLPIIAELASAMPAPFEAGSDIATETSTQVSYRVLPGASAGYLELLNAPWNPQRAIITVLGTNEQGLKMAGDALLISNLRSQLSGNYAVVNGVQVFSADTRTVSASSPGVIDTTGPVNIIPVDVSQDAPMSERPIWLLPVLGVTVLLMILVVVGVVLNSIRRRGQSA